MCSSDNCGGCVAVEIRASDIGTRAGLFEVQKIGDEFFTFVVDCDKPKACSIVLRGASKVRTKHMVHDIAAWQFDSYVSNTISVQLPEWQWPLNWSCNGNQITMKLPG